MPCSNTRRPAALMKKPCTSLTRRPSSNQVMRRPAVFVMPILTKKGQARMANRPIGHRATGKGYTRVVRSRFDKSRINGMLGTHSMVKLQSPQTISRLLTSKGLLPVRCICYLCGWKVKKGDYERRSGTYGYRCTNTSCRTRITTVHGHPLFQLWRRGLERSQQAAMVSSILHASSLVNIHVQLGISHRAVEDMALRVRQHIQKWVGILGCQYAIMRR